MDMAKREQFNKTIMNPEGNNHLEEHTNKEILLCSNCFRDEGLKIDAYNIGIDNNDVCPKCKSTSGKKLTKRLVHTLCHRFFVRGTVHEFDYGGAPLVQFNEHHFNKTDINVPPWLIDDLKKIEQAGEIGMFYYGPRFWMLGDIEPLKSLQKEHERNIVIERILTAYPVRELSDKDFFYRLRVNPEVPHDFGEYDTAPDEHLGRNRFDNNGFPVLYGSPDLELCLHECRTTVEDHLFVAKLVPTQKLKLLDLSALLEEKWVSEFESIDMAVHFLFLAGKHSYDICRQIALKAKLKAFDGIIYPSYFSHIRTGTFPFETIYGISVRRFPSLKNYAQSQSIPNVAIFGRPVKENKVTVECINKVVINRVIYDVTFGPAYV